MRNSLADIHAYWFEGIDDGRPIVKKRTPFVKWFRSTRVLDQEMRDGFGHLLEEEVRHPDQAPDRTALCRIILYDQLVRNMFRGTPRAYAYDETARDLSRDLITDGRHAGYMLIERVFIYMPLTHSENLADQELSVEWSRELAAVAGQRCPHNSAYFAGNLTYALKYRDIIARFGRFPNRNGILGRQSTAEEEEFLCRK